MPFDRWPLPSQVKRFIAVSFHKIAENRTNFGGNIGQNMESQPVWRVHDRNCQIGQVILEDFNIFHERILGFEKCQIDYEICEENEQDITHDCLLCPVPDRTELRSFLDIANQLLGLIPLLVELQHRYRFSIDGTLENEVSFQACNVRVECVIDVGLQGSLCDYQAFRAGVFAYRFSGFCLVQNRSVLLPFYR